MHSETPGSPNAEGFIILIEASTERDPMSNQSTELKIFQLSYDLNLSALVLTCRNKVIRGNHRWDELNN